MKNCIRQKIIHCGSYGRRSKYIEVDLFPYTENKTKNKGKRSKKKHISEPKQKNLNDKNAKRYFNQLVKSNFTEESDLHVSLTYKAAFLPDTIEEAEKEVRNYLRRIANERKREGIEPLKYVLVTERGKKGRIHHHVIMNGGLNRDVVEDLWSRPKKKGQKKGDKLGYANADRLQTDDLGVEGLCMYLSKDPQGKKRWKQSKNLIKPWSRSNDEKYSRRTIDKMAMLPSDCEEVKNFWEKKYKGYKLSECCPVWNDEIKRWSIYLKMNLKE